MSLGISTIRLVCFSVAKATLQLQMSVCQSVRQSVCLSQKPLSLSKLLLFAIKPIYHRAY